MLLIKVTNPFKTAIKREKGVIVTSKTDKENHGYGLKSVNETVEKYNGTVNINPDNDIFTITVVLYID